MPRRIATQVTQSVSRLLSGSFLKSEPLWYATTLEQPPVALPTRFARETPRQNVYLNKLAQGVTPSERERRQAVPSLKPRPITYLEDRVRRQFYKDHPWEVLRPRTLVEPGEGLSASAHTAKGKELRHWGRNPGPEDVIAATIELHKTHGLSLSTAYHTTLASYYALRAEHENASRYAVLEALDIGATFKPTETERSFQKEQQSLESSQGDARLSISRQQQLQQPAQQQSQPSAVSSPPTQTQRQTDFTGGINYLSSARGS